MFFLEVWGMRKRRRRQVAGERNYPNNVCTYEYMNKRKKSKDRTTILSCHTTLEHIAKGM
jgi:hypothetical protein